MLHTMEAQQHMELRKSVQIDVSFILNAKDLDTKTQVVIVR